jgi:hypothetical protein
MTEPYSVGAGIVGVLGLAIQISQVLLNFGLDWKKAPKDVKNFRIELQGLQMTLTEIQTRLVSNSSIEEAFKGNSSALLSHLKANDTSQDAIKDAFQNCQAQLMEMVKHLQAKEAGHRLGWGRLKAAFLCKKTQDAISQLQRQCGTLHKLVSVDNAVLASSTYLQVKGARKEQQEWHTAEENYKILRWLSQLSFEEKHRDVLSKLHPGTGQWLLDLAEFKAWMEGEIGSQPNMWCPGIRELTNGIRP